MKVSKVMKLTAEEIKFKYKLLLQLKLKIQSLEFQIKTDRVAFQKLQEKIRNGAQKIYELKTRMFTEIE